MTQSQTLEEHEPPEGEGLSLEEPDPPTRIRWWGVALVAIGLLASAALWTYALWGPRSDPPGTLDETSFPAVAEPVCSRATAEILRLPPAHETREAVERAEVIVEANTILAGQIDEMALLAPSDGSEDARRIADWLADWRTYLSDREAYAAGLTDDPETRMLETKKGGDHLSQALDFFARINAMPSCGPPGDVA